MSNTNLTAARAAKNDEFYTQRCDIEHEMTAYWAHNKDVFRDKTILLPCDDPERSNFTRFFAHNFERYGIKKLVSTSYAGADSDAERRGRKLVLESSSGQVDVDDLSWEYLEGDGDFRSEEVVALRDEADMVITNPPFSLFREFMAWLVEGGVEFSVIGNMNAATYKGIFPLVRDNKMWVGVNSKGGTRRGNSMLFTAPENAAIKNPIEYDGKPCAQVSAWWFTNIEHGRRYEKLQLMTMADNIRRSRRNKIREQGYPKYDNYDAIEVAFTEAIPSDYDGVMGVPISFLDKYDPEQFEILGCSYDYARPEGWPEDVKMSPSVGGKNVYRRILIRHSSREKTRAQAYPKYDNYDAIEVSSTKAIPKDYDGVMGVPISFLDRYNPEQFEIVGTTNSNAEDNPHRTRWYSADEKRQAYEDRFGRKGSYDLNAAGVVNGTKVYGRVLIRHRK